MLLKNNRSPKIIKMGMYENPYMAFPGITAEEM
jgi:hypothetical protein